ncbi:PHA/PHB synthase family protein [Ovoidimarina sediminis]|uniref:PHA/PHB synthase family protein n=1 Tax=Ovoidimarina sediminis TaxID=3079856 RepID=UPI0029148326|nr:alpha/beta fold hydrolase [Rhodophyticola sp. MJ-SS7]MDU8943742.1 alpha/beta fold hydrolase [Rhodophyticola sp. MJ-SS7]
MATRPDPDRLLHTAIGRVTGGISPAALATAWIDWILHLQGSPVRQMELARHAWANALEAAALANLAASGADIAPAHESADTRFASEGWAHPPFNLLSRWFLLNQDWWEHATAPQDGLDPAHQRIVSFAMRQMLDMVSPTNFPATNPDVLSRTRDEAGQNVIRGVQNWLEDFNQVVTGDRKPDGEYRVGETIAIAPGEVVFRNRLIELIRYTPTTPRVRAEPVLIVPAWIMKYYILDLSPDNSLIAWLRDQGFEVFAISWKNPDRDDADLALADYLSLGIGAALDKIAPEEDRRVHAVGYCLGGTLLAAQAAAMARDGDERFATVSLLAAQVDFSEPGELSLFINESQVAFLEDIMESQGYLRADQMAGAFRMLRSADLIWSRVIRHYLMGERTPMNDLMAWNTDATRMPAKMHSEYLRQMFLENRLATGRFRVGGEPVALTDIRVPVFCLGTEADHVSPWQSVYKFHLLADTDVTFCLTSGGHNGGVLSEPGHPGRHYRITERRETQKYTDPETWLERGKEKDGSWWPAWCDWLDARSTGTRPARKKRGRSLGPAPGNYVFG